MNTTTTEVKKAVSATVAKKKLAVKKAENIKLAGALKKAALKKDARDAKREEMVLFTLRIPPTLKADLDKYGKQRKLTAAEIIRTAMASYITNARKLGRMKG